MIVYQLAQDPLFLRFFIITLTDPIYKQSKSEESQLNNSPLKLMFSTPVQLAMHSIFEKKTNLDQQAEILPESQITKINRQNVNFNVN